MAINPKNLSIIGTLLAVMFHVHMIWCELLPNHAGCIHPQFNSNGQYEQNILRCGKYWIYLSASKSLDSLRSLSGILQTAVRIRYVTGKSPSTVRTTWNSSRPSLISSSKIWIPCSKLVSLAGISVTISVALKSLTAKNIKYTHKDELHCRKLIPVEF